jgi:hypothetical protein
MAVLSTTASVTPLQVPLQTPIIDLVRLVLKANKRKSVANLISQSRVFPMELVQQDPSSLMERVPSRTPLGRYMLVSECGLKSGDWVYIAPLQADEREEHQNVDAGTRGDRGKSYYCLLIVYLLLSQISPQFPRPPCC